MPNKMPSAQKSGNGTILIVDSDSMSSELLVFRFESEGFCTKTVSDGRKALEMNLSEFSLILVDLMKHEFNGLMFTKAVKNNPATYNIPIIIISEKASEDDVVDGLDAGADDYISKPYSSRELIARVRSVIRRKRIVTARRANTVVTFGSLTLDLTAGTVTLNGNKLPLTRTEYLILAMFLRNRNSFFERAEIIHEAWEDNEVSDRAVNTNISRLRKKLGDYGRNIINRQGFGYGFIE